MDVVNYECLDLICCWSHTKPTYQSKISIQRREEETELGTYALGSLVVENRPPKTCVDVTRLDCGHKIYQLGILNFVTGIGMAFVITLRD